MIFRSLAVAAVLSFLVGGLICVEQLTELEHEMFDHTSVEFLTSRVRDHILLKQGRLDVEKFTIMQTHVLHVLDMVNKCLWLQNAAEVVGFHQEKLDGRGTIRA